MNLVSIMVALVIAGLTAFVTVVTDSITVLILGLLLTLAAATSIKVAQEWDRAIVLRLGKKDRVAGPGPFLLVPVVDRVAAWIDTRIQSTPFNTEKTLTRDTTPVNVDAVVFWLVQDPEMAALQLTDYEEAIPLVAQTSLREVIGESELSVLLANRQTVDDKLKELLTRKTCEWGITIKSVEIRDVVLPTSLQDAMSRQAQAEREKQARVTLASAEKEIAQQFEEAAQRYKDNPVAMDLLRISRLYEMNKDRGTFILMPTGMVDSMAATGTAIALQNAFQEGGKVTPVPKAA